MEESEENNIDNLRSSEFEALFHKREQEIYFNIMVIGEKSLGKSTYIETLLERKFRMEEIIKPATDKIQEYCAVREEGKINLFLKLIDTPGYDKKEGFQAWYKLMKDYIKKKFIGRMKSEANMLKSYLKDKKTFNSRIDETVHVILFFIAGPRIKREDVMLMKKFQKYTNIIPVIPKGDSYTVEEINEMKMSIIQQAAEQQIKWFDCFEPLKDFPDKLEKLNNGPLGPSPPFLLISSTERVLTSKSTFAYGRVYNWGVCNIDNPNHCDFSILYNLLIGHYCLTLIQSVNDEFFPLFVERRKRNKRLKKQKLDSEIKLIGFSICMVLGGSFVLTQLIKRK